MASAMVVTKTYDPSQEHSPLVLKLACTAHTDGTFDAKRITAAEVGFNYWQYGLYLYEAWTINPASVYPTVAGVVSIVDEAGSPILVSDPAELTLSTSASVVVEAAPAKSRLVNSELTVSVGDTGNAANTFDLYLKFVR
jgi:hypothetical protein